MKQRISREKEKCFIHKSSYVDKNVKIGKGTKVWHFSHILENSIIGKNCIIGQNVMIGPDVNIGRGCKIQNNVSVYKGVNLAEEVFVGPSVVFTNVINPRAFIERKDEFRKTWVKKGVTIGANVTIVCGLTIGEYALIGAGAVVTKDVPDYGLVYGNPAVLKGWMCSCGVSINFKTSTTSCKKCKRNYNKEGSKVKVLQ